MVDMSSSVGIKENFQLMINFVTNIFHSFNFGGGVRYGLVVFGDQARVKKYSSNI